MRPTTISVGPLAAADATNIRTAGAIAGAGVLTLDGTLVSGGVATLDKPRRIRFTSSGNDTGINFTIVGTNWSGAAISEVVTGANASTADSDLDFATISSIVASGAAAGTVSIGTNGVAGSEWVAIDPWSLPNVAIQVNVSGTLNYTIQSTLDNPNSPTDPVTPENMVWVPTNDTAAVGATASLQTNFFFVPAYVRLLINSGSGSATVQVIQSGVVGV